MPNGQVFGGSTGARAGEERHAYRISSVRSHGRGGSGGGSLIDMARTAGEDLLDLLASQLKLARLELASDVKQAVGPVVALALFSLIALIGYAFGMSAVAAWLSRYWGWTMALGAVAASQLMVGVSGMAWAVHRLRGRRVLGRARVDLAEFAENVRQTLVVVTQPSRSVDV